MGAPRRVRDPIRTTEVCLDPRHGFGRFVANTNVGPAFRRTRGYPHVGFLTRTPADQRWLRPLVWVDTSWQSGGPRRQVGVTTLVLTLILGLAMTAVALPIAGRRVWFLYRLITSGQPAPDRVENVTKRAGETVKTQLVEVLGQKKLLKWSVPGAAHFFVFWAFLILASVYLEAYGSLFHRGLPHPGDRPLVGAGVRAGLHRRDGVLRPRDVRDHQGGRTRRRSSAAGPGSRARIWVAPGWCC